MYKLRRNRVLHTNLLATIFRSRPYRCAFSTLSAFFFGLLASTATAQTENALVRGEISKVRALLSAARNTQCEAVRCLVQSAPIHLTASIAGGRPLRITLQEMRLPNNVIRSRDNGAETDQETRPILMRGFAVTRGAEAQRDGLTIPVAATLYRDQEPPILEITTNHQPTRRAGRYRGLIVFRAPLTSLATSTAKNTRAQASSSVAYSARKCGFDGSNMATLRSTDYTGSPPTKALATYNILYLATDYDSQFAPKVGCATVSECHNKVLSIVNQAGVFYEDQVGYTFEVARQFGPTSPGSSTLAENFLDDVQQYNQTNRLSVVHTGTNSNPNQIDLFQFFTGRTMQSDVIGIAYVETTCRNDRSEFANVIVQRVSNTLDPVTTAHEIGHSLNADHTASGIMKANLGSPPPQSFSSESVTVINNHLNTWYGECRQGQSSGSPDPTPTATPQPTPSGGGAGDGGGSLPPANTPLTLRLSVRSSAAQRVTLSTTATSVTPGCLVRLRASGNFDTARTGTVVKEITPTTLRTSLSARITSGVTTSRTSNGIVYIAAEHICSDNTYLEVSSIKQFNPNKIRGIRGRVSRSSWIRQLKKALR